MIFELAEDFRQTLEAMPRDHGRHGLLQLLERALRRDIHFIARHRDDYPQGFFQQMWNLCWWHDCPEAENHYEQPTATWEIKNIPWRTNAAKLYLALEQWNAERKDLGLNVPWVCSRRPDPCPLVGPLSAAYNATAGVNGIAFSRDGQRLACASGIHVSVWSVDRGAKLLAARCPVDQANCVAFSPDGSHLLIGGDKRSPSICELDSFTGEHIRTLRGHTHRIYSVTYSPDGERILSASGDGTIGIWHAGAGSLLCTLPAALRVHTAMFSPDGKIIASGGNDGVVRLWRSDTLQLLHEYSQHTNSINCLAFAAGGSLIFSGSEDRTVRVWDTRSGRCVHVIDHDSAVHALVISPDGSQFASGSGEIIRHHSDPNVRLWSASNFRLMGVFGGHDVRVNCLAYAPNRLDLASGGADGRVFIWNTETEAFDLRLRNHEREIHDLAVSPNGAHVATSSEERAIRLWGVGRRLQSRTLLLDEVQDPNVFVQADQIAFSPSGNLFACSDSWQHTIRMWDVSTGRLMRSLPGHEDHVYALAFSPDGKLIASGARDGKLFVYDIESGSQVFGIYERYRTVYCVAFSPDGRRLAIDNRLSIALYDPRSGRCEAQWRAHDDDIRALAWSGDGNRIASASNDKAVRLWDARSGQMIREYRGHEGRVTHVVLSADGSRIGSESTGWFGDGTIRVWDSESGDVLDTIAAGSDLAAVVAGAVRYPLRVELCAFETVIAEVGAATMVACCPLEMRKIVTLFTGLEWAAVRGNQLYVLSVVGYATGKEAGSP